MLVAVGAGAEVSWSLNSKVAAFLGVHFGLLDDGTSVRVQGKPATVIPAWESSIALGLNIRIP